MCWGYIGGSAVAVVGGALLGGGKSGGGAGATTATKEPWAEAAPWLKDNIKTGQSLQAQYAANPFNNQQLNAYGNMGNTAAYANKLIPDLMGQLGTQTGYDRSNPKAKPTAFDFNGTGANAQYVAPTPAPASTGATGGGLWGLVGLGVETPDVPGQWSNPGDPIVPRASTTGQAVAAAPAATASTVRPGLLGMLSAPTTSNTSAANPIPSAVAPPAPTGDGTFSQTTLGDTRNNWTGSTGGAAGTYGTFTYGDAMPQPGTQAYRDMSSYFSNGGTDPSNLYGHGAPAPYQDTSSGGM